jgi:hypothetical protein
MKLGHEKSYVFDIVEKNLFMGEYLHMLPEILVPLAYNVIGND